MVKLSSLIGNVRLSKGGKTIWMAIACIAASGMLLMKAKSFNQSNFEVELFSSKCISMRRPSCGVAIPGGRLHLTNISFPNGESEPGTAYATGIVNGEVVYGTVKVKGDPDWDKKKEEEGDDDAGMYNATVAGQSLAPLDAQYQNAIRQVVSNMDQKTAALNHDADTIAKAVTKVITSSTVSSTIADLAWNIAEQRYKAANSKLTAGEKDQLDALLTNAQGSIQAARASSSQLSSAAASTEWGPAMHTWREEGVVRSGATLSDAAAKPEVENGISPLAEETIQDNPAAGATGPRAGTFYGGSVCAGCLVCPGCCSNGWVPGCKAFNQSSEESEEEEHEGKKLGQQLNDKLFLNPAQSIPQYNRVDTYYKSVLRSMEMNREMRRRQVDLVKELDDERERRAKALQAKVQEEQQRQRAAKLAEFQPLEQIAMPTIGSLADPWSAYRQYQAVANGHYIDASARYLPQ